MNRPSLLSCAMVLAPALASAQPKTADDWYKDGENKYNLGDFQGAVESFKKGFEVEPNDSKKAAYLFNVAQAYRMAKDCGNAQFFYKRYLSLKDNDAKKPLAEAKRKEIEDRIQDLDECAKQQEASKSHPPGEDKNKQVASTDGADGGGEVVGDDGAVHGRAEARAPHRIDLRGFGGGTKLSAGDLDVPMRATFGAVAGYPLALGPRLTLELGAAFTFTPIAYDTMGTTKSAQMTATMANVAASYAVLPKLSLRGDLGAGGMFFSGIGDSLFTNGRPTTGALAMFHLRLGVSADYAVTPSFLITAIPFAFSYSPAHAGLRDGIKTITAIDVMVGVGYRM